MATVTNFPTAPGFSAVNFRQLDETKISKTQSGRTIRHGNATTRWAATLSYPPMSTAEARPIKAFIAQLKGGLNDFDVILPEISTPQGTATSNPFDMRSSAAAGATSVSVRFADSSTDDSSEGATVYLKPGDLIRFSGHTKVYMVTGDVTSNSAGELTINFQPGLVSAVSVNETITTNDVPIRVHLANSIQEYGYAVDGTIALELDVEEVI